MQGTSGELVGLRALDIVRQAEGLDEVFAQRVRNISRSDEPEAVRQNPKENQIITRIVTGRAILAVIFLEPVKDGLRQGQRSRRVSDERGYRIGRAKGAVPKIQGRLNHIHNGLGHGEAIFRFEGLEAIYLVDADVVGVGTPQPVKVTSRHRPRSEATITNIPHHQDRRDEEPPPYEASAGRGSELGVDGHRRVRCQDKL